MKAKTFSNCLFDGIEAEGPYRGAHTLFISGDINPDKILEAARHFKYEVFYFGAGNFYNITPECEKIIIKLKEQGKVVLEINDTRTLQQLDTRTIINTEIIFSFQQNETSIYSCDIDILKSRVKYLKFQNEEKIIWIPITGMFYLTSMSDEYFKYDREVKL